MWNFIMIYFIKCIFRNYNYIICIYCICCI